MWIRVLTAAMMLAPMASEPVLAQAAAGAPNWTPAQRAANDAGLCARDWPDNYVMQEHCRRQQREGWDQWFAAMARADHGMQRALMKCLADWDELGRINAMMAGHCARQQTEARDRMR